jgi:excisionase family DNA binding protein
MSVPSTALSDHERKGAARKESRRARDPPDPLTPLTVKEAAALLRCNPKTVYEGIRQKQIPAVRIGNLLLISRPWFMRMLRGAEGEAP